MLDLMLARKLARSFGYDRVIDIYRDEIHYDYTLFGDAAANLIAHSVYS